MIKYQKFDSNDTQMKPRLELLKSFVLNQSLILIFVQILSSMKPLVSVIMITYGHEKYIEEAIRGVFLQKTNFPFELIISNDKSPDSTDEIVKNIIKYAPENISVKYIQHPENIGMLPNFISTLKIATGKYIAVCEGDDYWTDENKLQKQIDFLEKNEDFTLTFHNVFIRNGETLRADLDYEKRLSSKNVYTINDLSKGNFIHTLSVVFRNMKIEFPEWYYTSFLGDYPIWLWLSKKGKIKYFPEKMGVYRENVGVWSGKSQEEREFKSMLVLRNLIPDFEMLPDVKKNLTYTKNIYIKNFLKQKSFAEVVTSPYFSELKYKDKFKLVVKSILK
jgi:glycosyltransferase